MGNEKVRHKGSEVPIISKANFKGEVNPEDVIEVSLYLRRKPSSPGPPSIKDVTKTLLSQQKHLSHQEFEKLHGAEPMDVEKIKAFAAENNLKLAEFNLARRLVRLKGKIKDMAAAFGVTFSKFEHEDRTFRGHKGAVHLPKELKDIVTGVFGLSSHVVARPHISPHIKVPSPYKTEQRISYLKESTVEQVHFNIAPYFTPTQVARAYHFPTDVQGDGQTIGIIQLGGGYTRDCLDNYFEILNVIQGSDFKTPTIKDMECGGHNQPNKLWLYDVEVCGDIEVIGAIANKANLVIYFSSQDEHGTEKAFLDAVSAAVNDSENSPAVISISWGHREKYYTSAFIEQMNEILVDAFNKGITVCVATGDTGSSDCGDPFNLPDKLAHVDFPASSPWVLACGGTILSTNGSEPTGEVVWNEGRILGATGGGVSDHFECPDWQTEAGILPKSVNDSHIGRGIPDVAGNSANQSGYFIMINNGIRLFGGGTSAVSPLWAALVAMFNQKLSQELGVPTKLGFINPKLYQVKADGAAFNDITSGNNQNIPEVPGYFAASGWDACTGLGTPKGEELYQALRQDFK